MSASALRDDGLSASEEVLDAALAHAQRAGEDLARDADRAERLLLRPAPRGIGFKNP